MDGRTEFLPQRLEASPSFEAQTTHESEMALFNECMQEYAQIVFDTADIVRDGDITSVTVAGYTQTLESRKEALKIWRSSASGPFPQPLLRSF
jgi:hypothetical protein